MPRRLAKFITAFVLVFFSLAFEQSAHAQTYPSDCKPLGGKNCAAKIPTSFTYQARLCSAAYFFQSEPEAANHYINESGVDNQTPWCPAPVITPQGYADGDYVHSGAHPEGFSAPCTGSLGPFPIVKGGYDVRNFSLYNVLRYLNGSACDEDNYVIGMVDRNRSLVCPEGYGASSAATICKRDDDETDVGKNLGPCEGKGQCPVGNPINPGVGNKYQVERDFDSGGPNPLRFERYYNSFAGRTTNANGLYRFGKSGNDSQTAAMNPENEAHVSAIAADTIGVNWRHTYHRAVARSGLGSLLTASIYRPTGQVLFFSFYNGEWVTDADVNYTLNELTDAGETTGWEVTTPSDELETYSASGKLLTIADRNGVTQSLTYDAIGRVQTVTDHFGRIMTFHYAADPQGGSEWWEEPGVNARITSIADPDGEIFSYTYDVDGNLSQVTYPDSTEREYRYEDANFPYALTAIIDENDDQFATFAYDSAGRAITSWHGEGTDVVERVDVDYTTDTGDPIYGQNSAVVTEAQGTGDEIVHDMNFSRILGVSKMTSESSGTSTRSLTYDGDGNVARATDYRGNVTYRQYDARNLEISRTEAELTSVERTITAAWNADYRLQELVMRPSVYGSGSQQTDYAYVVQSPLVESISETGFEPDGDAISRVTAFTYNGDGQVLTVDGPRTDVTDVTTFSYYDCDTGYECGQVREIENALGQIATYDAYNGRGQLLQMTGPNGLVSSYAYDERGHLESVTRMPISGPARVTTMSYDDAGQLQSVSTPDGLVLTYSCDSAHKLRSVTDNVGNRIGYNYDARGNLKDEDTYDPGNVLKRQVDYTYDLNDRLDTINNGGFVTDLTFDMVGNLISEIDPTLAETEHSYDPHNRLDLTTDALTGQTDYAYDVNDNLTAVTAPNDAATSYAFDDFGNLLSEVSPDRGTTTYTYDDAGNVITSTDARGKVTTYTYDALNRVTEIELDNNDTITYEYDTGTNGIGRLAKIMDPSGETTWTYNNFGQVTSKTHKVGTISLTTAYGYDAAGRLTTMAPPSGKVLTYGYNDHLPVSVTVDSTTILSGATYDPFGPVNGWTWGNSTSHSRSFDLRGLLDSQSMITDTRILTYDDAGRLITLDDARHDLGFDYDDLGRLTDFTASGSAPLPASQYFTYDENHNRESITENGTPYSYTNVAYSNRLTSTTGPTAKSLTYDAAGNVTNDGIHSYGYDDRGRLVSVDSGAMTYQHNGQGQRVQKDNGTATLFAYDEAGQLIGEYDVSGDPIQETVSFNGAPVAVLVGSNEYYVHTDHLGTPRVITDGNIVIWRWESDPFGTAAAQEDPDGDLTDFTYNLRFPGQYYDEETGLHYNYFRTYDPSTGRYLESDPIGLEGGLNTYGYALQNPLMYTDPTGEGPITFRVCVGAAALDVALSIRKLNEIKERTRQLQEDVEKSLSCMQGEGEYGDADRLNLLLAYQEQANELAFEYGKSQAFAWATGLGISALCILSLNPALP